MAVMAKAPRVGQAKTRLAAALSPEAAAGLSACFIRDAIGNIAAAAREAAIDGYIAFSPARRGRGVPRHADRRHRAAAVAPRRGWRVSLYDAAADFWPAGYGSVCLINSDSPTLPTAVLVDAARLLSEPATGSCSVRLKTAAIT